MTRRPWAALAGLVAAVLAAPAAGVPLVAIDPGHGDGDSGAVGALEPGVETGLTPRQADRGTPLILEKDVTLDVGLRLRAWLEARGYPTVMTRTTDLAGGDRPYVDERTDLKARVDVANRAGADVFVSIHQNALDETATGTETYHYRQADRSGRALALAIHQQVALRLGLPDRGVKSAGFYVLKHTAMPAVLVEGAFLSNPAEARLMADPLNRQRMAEGIGAGIARYVRDDVVLPTDARGRYPRPPLVTRYWVTAGVFRGRLDAERRRAALAREDATAVVRSRFAPRFGRSMWFVVSEQVVFLEEARRVRDRLRAAGFPARVNAAPTR